MKIIVLLSCITCICSCSIVHEISIKKESVHYIEKNETARIVGNDIGIPLLKDWTSGGYIVLQFSASEDLEELSEKKHSAISSVVEFCNKDSSKVLLGSHVVYHRGNIVSRRRLDETREKESNESLNGFQNQKYEIIVFTEWKKERLFSSTDENSTEKFYEKYDFRVLSEDICIRVEGAHVFRSIESNTIRLSNLEIMNLMIGH